MAKEREPPSIADYVVTALSPALIMGLVGSLAFFLLEILYAGEWEGRLRWTLSFFVFGAVLVGRISIQIDRTQAWIYRLFLGGATLLAMWRFADANLVLDLIIVVVVLWSADKLTWDCTYVDESAEDGGGGLLEEIGDDLASREREQPEFLNSKETSVADAPGSPRKARPMGRWVIYFSLAALPLFGLAQALIPAEDEARRRYAFWLMTIYVASGLGLLLTTTLLGLRRYLRRRKLQMPAAMTGLWLGAGAAMIAGLLLVAALLPLSHPQYSLIPIRPLGSAEAGASRVAMRSDKAAKGENRGGEGKAENAKDGSGGKGQTGGKQAGQTGKPEGQGGDKSGGKGDGKSKTGEQSKSQNGGEKKADASDDSHTPSTSLFTTLANILKWIVLAILAIIVALVVLWFAARHLSEVSDWARRLFEALSAFWRSLFGGSAPVTADIEEAVVVQERPRAFAAFRNPFADGSAAGRSPDALVRYSFAALEAWAFQRDLPRRPDETPLEFAERVGAGVAALAADARQLTGLYARLAYAGRRLPEASRATVEAFWRALESSAVASGSPLHANDRARLDSQRHVRL